MTLDYPPYIMLSLFVVVLGYFWLLLLFCKLPLSILLCFREREFCDAVSINLFPTEEQFLSVLSYMTIEGPIWDLFTDE